MLYTTYAIIFIRISGVNFQSAVFHIL